MKKVLIIMGSKSDLGAVKPAFDIVKDFGIECDMRVMSAHRTPLATAEIASSALAVGYGVIIAAAGKAAHLAGVIAGHTILPVIGLPIKSSTLDGLDSLLSTVQMPNGVPVATVAIGGGINAGLLAVQMLAINDVELQGKLIEYKENMAKAVLKDNEMLQEEIK